MEIDAEGEASDSGGSDWSEEPEIPQPTRCILCSAELSSADAVWQHCESEHGIALSNLKFADCYDYIKFVNYCRQKNPSVNEILSCSEPPAWCEDSFLKPIDPEDPLLLYDVEALLFPNLDNSEIIMAESGETAPGNSSKPTLEDMQCLVQQLRTKLQEAISLPCSSGPVDGIDDNDLAYFDTYSHYSIHDEMLKVKDCLCINSFLNLFRKL